MRRSGCVASTHGNREIEAWAQSVKPFFSTLCGRGCETGMAEKMVGH